MGIVWLILGLIYMVRRPKIAGLMPAASPHVAPEQFRLWQQAELRSIDLFLLATWGQGAFFFCLGLVLGLLAAPNMPEGDLDRMGALLTGVQIVLFLVGLVASAIYGSRAAKMKREFAIAA